MPELQLKPAPLRLLVFILHISVHRLVQTEVHLRDEARENV